MNLWLKPNFLAITALLVISLFALKDLTKPNLYTSHDGETHTARIAQYYKALSDGQLPPRFAESFYNNLGSPIFVYIYPLPYILGSFLHLTGLSFVNSFKAIMAICFLFSGVFTYIWIKEIFKSNRAAVVGALFYMFSPYRLQLIYVRGSISEITAYTFLPLVLFFITKLRENKTTKIVILTSLSISALLLSQNLVALITLPVIFLYSAYISYTDKSYEVLIKTTLSTLLAFTISAFTYIPAIFERSYVKFDEVFKLVYGSHFVTFKQIVRSPWGYGFDLPGIVNDQMSFQIGLAHWLIIITALFLILWLAFKRDKKLIKDELILVVSSFTLLILFIFLALDSEPTKFLWKNIKVIQLIDIPWRILGLVPVSVAILAAFTVNKLRAGVITFFLIIALLYANRNHVRINKSLDFTDQDFLKYKGTSTQLSEFTPSDRRNVSVPDFNNSSLIVNTAGGWARYSNISSNSRKVSFNVSVLSEDAQIRVNRFYFPGVRVNAYNNEVTVNQRIISYPEGNVRLDTLRDTYGFIYLPIKKGDYRIEVIFGETKLRLMANLLSIFSILVAFYLYKNERRV